MLESLAFRRDRIVMDPLSQVLSLLDIRGGRCTRFEASGAWSYRFPSKSALKFGAVMAGACWIEFDEGARHAISAGDCFLLARAPSYVLANDDQRVPEDGIAAFDWERSDTARHEGDDTVLIAGSFVVDTTDAGWLLDALPHFLVIPADHAAAAVIRATLQWLDGEIKSDAMGAATLTERLVDILLVQVLRAATERDGGADFGWLGALTDTRMGAAIRAMHRDAARAWTLDELAASVAMSRAAFAKRFRAAVGVAPIEYLLRWRMQLARHLLRHGATVAETSTKVGYASESAFGHAFKRVYGDSPRRHGRQGDVSP